jgi:hypothetical protein
VTDEYFREQSARRARRLYLISGLVIGVICLGIGVISLFYDSCTRSFDRAPQTVISSYIDWISQGNPSQAQKCWDRDAYYNLDSGCSEICLQRNLGKQLVITSVSFDPTQVSSSDGLLMNGTLEVTCQQSGKVEKGQFTLHTPNQSVGWKHWQIRNSSIGGTLAEPWCK